MKWIPPFGASDPNAEYVNAQPTIAGSNPDAGFFNTILTELLAVIRAADMTPSNTNLHQVSDAVVTLTERAATSGVTKGAYWFGKTLAATVVPAPTIIGQNYIDFTTLKTYVSNDGETWTESTTFVPPVGIDYTILITSKFWDIPEQSSQQGGEAKYNHTDDTWAYWPKIISFENAVLSGVCTAPTPTAYSPNTQIATKAYVDSSASNDLFDFKWKDCTINNLNWALSDGNWKAQIKPYEHLLSDIGAEHLYAWAYGVLIMYTLSETPTVEGNIYGFVQSMCRYFVNTDYTITAVSENSITISDGSGSVTLTRSQENDKFGTNKSLTTETIGDTTISFFLSDDGHKICPVGQESNMDAIYTATGVAWYYLIDTENQKFKLPRTKFGFTGLRDTVGNYVEAGLPNITANAAFSYGTLCPTTLTGAFRSSGNHSTRAQGEGGTSPLNIELDASLSSPVYGNSTTVQPPATQMYLYFYVGIGN